MCCLDLEGWGWCGSPIAPPPGGREWASQVQAGFTWHCGRFCRPNLEAQACISPVCTALTPVTLFPEQGHTHIWQRARPGCAAGAALSRAGRPLGGW